MLWLSDFVYVATWQGFVYVAFVIDAFADASSRAVRARNIPKLSAWAHGLLQDRVLPTVTAAIAAAHKRARVIDSDQ